MRGAPPLADELACVVVVLSLQRATRGCPTGASAIANAVSRSAARVARVSRVSTTKPRRSAIKTWLTEPSGAACPVAFLSRRTSGRWSRPVSRRGATPPGRRDSGGPWIVRRRIGWHSLLTLAALRPGPRLHPGLVHRACAHPTTKDAAWPRLGRG